MVEKTPGLSRRESEMHELCHVTYFLKNADTIPSIGTAQAKRQTRTEKNHRHTEYIEAVSCAIEDVREDIEVVREDIEVVREDIEVVREDIEVRRMRSGIAGRTSTADDSGRAL